MRARYSLRWQLLSRRLSELQHCRWDDCMLSTRFSSGENRPLPWNSLLPLLALRRGEDDEHARIYRRSIIRQVDKALSWVQQNEAWRGLDCCASTK